MVVVFSSSACGSGNFLHSIFHPGPWMGDLGGLENWLAGDPRRALMCRKAGIDYESCVH
jgi:hypothetical protein